MGQSGGSTTTGHHPNRADFWNGCVMAMLSGPTVPIEAGSVRAHGATIPLLRPRGRTQGPMYITGGNSSSQALQPSGGGRVGAYGSSDGWTPIHPAPEQIRFDASRASSSRGAFR